MVALAVGGRHVTVAARLTNVTLCLWSSKSHRQKVVNRACIIDERRQQTRSDEETRNASARVRHDLNTSRYTKYEWLNIGVITVFCFLVDMTILRWTHDENWQKRSRRACRCILKNFISNRRTQQDISFPFAFVFIAVNSPHVLVDYSSNTRKLYDFGYSTTVRSS